MSHITQSDKEFTGRHMLIAILGFFFVILAANLTLVFFASNSWTGLVTKNGYKENQVFDKKTTEMETLLQAGYRLVPSYQNNKIQIKVLTNSSEPVLNADLDVLIGRVIHERDDIVVTFKHTSGGVYVADQILAPGLWQLKVLMHLDGEKRWQKTYRLIVGEK